MSAFDACRQEFARDINPSRRVFVATSLASGLALAVQPVAANQERSLQMEITISPNREVATLINVFVVEPDNQDKLIQILKEGTEALFRKQAGYISASFHKSMDGRRVVNYAQWRSPKDIDAFRGKPEIGEYFKRIRELAQFELMICDVSYVNRV